MENPVGSTQHPAWLIQTFDTVLPGEAEGSSALWETRKEFLQVRSNNRPFPSELNRPFFRFKRAAVYLQFKPSEGHRRFKRMFRWSIRCFPKKLARSVPALHSFPSSIRRFHPDWSGRPALLVRTPMKVEPNRPGWSFVPSGHPKMTFQVKARSPTDSLSALDEAFQGRKTNRLAPGSPSGRSSNRSRWSSTPPGKSEDLPEGKVDRLFRLSVRPKRSPGSGWLNIRPY